ncbi:MAG: RNA 2',3'-cyclic phosphodiesterase [Candidatus Limnocylindria bacterium]
MSHELWRCFVAVPIADGLRTALADELAGWRERPDLSGLRWADPAAWHVTLAFIGSIDAATVADLADALASVGDEEEPITLACGGLGAFPSASHARVAWYGVADPEAQFRNLAKRTRRAVGVPAHQPFRPHVTLARARPQPVDLRGWVAEAASPVGTLVVDRLHLMRSHLGSGPARYETIASVPLRATSHV